MNHRKTMGFTVDAAETAALTIVDPRAFARTVLGGKSWHDLGVSRQAFSVRLKKVEKVISAR